MAAPGDISAHIDALNALFDSVVDTVSDSVSTGLGTFHDLLEEATPDDFAVVNDAVVVVLETAEAAGEAGSAMLAEVFDAWAQTFAAVDEALADMLRRLHQHFSTTPALFRQATQALAATLSDFPTRFRDLARFLLENPAKIVPAMDTVLLPLLAAAMAVFQTDVVAEALWALLRDSVGALGELVAATALGLQEAALGALSELALASEAFRLTVGVWLVAGLLDALRQAGEFAALFDGLATGNAALDAALGPVSSLFAQAAVAYIEDVETLAEALVARLIEDAENDAELEWLLLQVARFSPVGLFLLAIATAAKLVTSPAPWLTLLLNPIEDDPRFSVVRLPRPSAARKYVVFSDVHRDEADAARPPYQLGSIDHFLPNRETYLEILKHHAEAGYTIIEAGDCEELWFHRDFSVTPTEKLAQIIATNSEIYGLLAELHAQGRYLRVFGNHDSYLRDPETFGVLRQAMERDGGPTFRIHDFVIVEGVKTMHDVPVFLGLDSEPNVERKPLIVTHGHQWDFWNCDANNILGKIIVSAVVTPLDMLDDPLRDIGGISSFGRPFVNFRQMLGDLPVFNSWQSYEPAVQKLDAVQHQKEELRFFMDDVQYSETLAALMGMMIPVRPGPGDACDFALPGGCLMNLMSIGHTHNPHNMPYFDLGEMPIAKPLADQIEAELNAVTFGLYDGNVGLLRSNYINTGVCGWYEDCFYALDLGDQSHGTGQPKLVTWTWNTRLDRPNHMDWELPHVPREGGPTPGDLLDARVKALIAAGIDLVRDRASDMVAAMPAAAALGAAAKDWRPRDLEIDLGRGGHAADALLLQLAVAFLPGTSGRFTARLTLPRRLADELAGLSKQRLPGSGKSERRGLCAAIAALALRHGVARNGLRGQNGGDDAVAAGLLFTLAQLQEAKRDDVRVQIAVASGGVSVTVIAEAERAPRPAVKADPKALREIRSRARGLEVHAFAEETGTPLAGWTVALEEGPADRRRVVATARTDREGKAMLLGARVEADALMRGSTSLAAPAVALTPPMSKPARRAALEPIRIALDRTPAKASVSLPVTRADLVLAGVFPGSKIPSREQRQKAVCDQWKKRLSLGRRDPFAPADLFLQDLVLSTMGALDDPKTAVERRVAKIVKTQLKDTSAMAKAAELARAARARLKDCLGADYRPCDGSGSPATVGERLLKEDPRFSGLVKFFGNSTPNPLLEFTEPKAGIGLAVEVRFEKDCQAQFEAGDLAPDLAAEMQTWLETPSVLAPPQVNRVEVWDPAFAGGRVVRDADIPDKTLTFHKLRIEGTTPNVVTQTVDMDVPVSSPGCLVLAVDGSNRQLMVTDVRPGQVVTLWGSGFVNETAQISASRRPWAAVVSNGRLVPQDDTLGAPGFDGLASLVRGDQYPAAPDDTPTTFNGDSLRFAWPAEAAQPGLYRIRVSFDNATDYASSVTQNADCSFTVDRGPVSTQDVYFAVLPAPQTPAVRSRVDEVECIDITDPEAVAFIPWPDDLRLLGITTRLSLTLPETADGDVTETLSDTFTREASTYMAFPGIWAVPGMQLFPQDQPFADILPFESVITHVELFEVEGSFDKAVVGSILTIAVLVTAVLAALVISALFAIALVAVIAALSEPTPLGEAAIAAIVAGFGAALAPFLTFIFGTAFTALSGGIAAIIAEVDGQASLVGETVRLDGHRLLYDLSEIRFIRVQGEATGDAVPPIASFDETFANSALGGTYEVSLDVTVES